MPANRRARRSSNHNSSRGGAPTTTEAVSTLVRGGFDVLRSHMGSSADHIGDFAREQVDRFLRDRKDRAADKLSAVGRAIRVAGENLHDRGVDSVGNYVDSTAQRVESIARFIERHDLTELSRQAERFTRRHPATVFAGLLVAGVVAGRFVRIGLSQR